LFFLIFFWEDPFKKFLLACSLFFILGGLRFYLSLPAKGLDSLNYYHGREIIFLGKINLPPQITDRSTQVIVGAQSMGGKKISGKVLLFLPVYNDLKFADRIIVECHLQKPIGKDSFNSYDKYLARDGIWSVCNKPIIEKIDYQLSSLEKIITWFFDFKQNIQNQINLLWPEPESSLIAGLLYGARSGFSDELKQDFAQSGITHIVAISGYNISLVASILISTLLRLGWNRLRAFWLAVFGIVLFVLFTGASASVVRAGIMGIVVLLSSWLGRLSRVGNILVFTAALMLLFNPFVLVWDIGFQLSFLSTLGLIYLSPILDVSFIKFGKNIFLNSLRENFISTLSAILATLPLILFQFGRLSVVAPLANLLILWIIPFLMLFSFVAVALSYLFFIPAQIIAWFGYLGSKYVIILAHNFAHWPLASFNLYLPWWAMFSAYGVIVYWIKRKNKLEKDYVQN
jgi:competence protein ComEC